MSWKPTKVTDVLEFFESSTRPLKVLTDEGPALLKYMGNKMGDDVLISELVAAGLLRALGIPSPDFALIDFDPNPELRTSLRAQKGPAFATKWYPYAFPFSGTADVLETLSNPECIAQLIVFDTWVQNKDRFLRSGDVSSDNFDNLLFVPDGKKNKMVLIDHSEAFIETSFDVDLDETWHEDTTPHGFHPTFATFLSEEDIYRSIDAIQEITSSELDKITSDVPYDWSFSSNRREALAVGLQMRREAMKSWLPNALLTQPALGFEWGKR